MSRFLESMAERSWERVETARRNRPLPELEEAAATGPAPRPLGDCGVDFDLIAEVKPRSPSEGRFPDRPPAEAAAAYVRGGARVISVLTEPSEFGGSLDNLREVSRAAEVPVMAKDFIVDPYQVFEARLAGADGVLVIARLLDEETMKAILDAAAGLGMFSLLEAFDMEDIQRIGKAAQDRPATLVGVNCRDLETLEIVPERHAELAVHLPAGMVAVAESAMATPDDVERVAGHGYRAALVGSALMRAEDPEQLTRALVDAGRRTMVAR